MINNCCLACSNVWNDPAQRENRKGLNTGIILMIALLVPGILGLTGVAAISHTSACVLTGFGSLGFLIFAHSTLDMLRKCYREHKQM
ncbi:MAG: hypothetical protein JSS62_01170 [Verrucomicrobia bacterium]|nr:hypothetical protein [Verrucomicrobiota bacterium]MBS0646079.1 hypothetical protein [Verrucomicrobiota bacterium]